ncbi:tRNA lysidine(34) synthetase TilS [Rossellomorea sp. H39__3]
MHRLIEKGDRLLVAVSGGPDSLALLHFLHALREELDVEVAAAHVDHMFRGRESYDDLLFVEGFCKDRDIPFFGERINIPAMMKTEKGSLQEMARKARYAYLEQVMTTYGGNKLALGHHGDDQIETILMKWTRGAGGKGRAGIPFRRPFSTGEIIRPFLSVTKADILDYCERERLSPRIDPSNRKDTYTRNRFRSRVLPFLKEENPNVHRNFQQFSEESLEDEEFLEELTRVKLNKVWKVEEDFSTLDIKRFLQMAQPLQRRAINLILNYLYKLKPASLSSIHIYDVLRLLKGRIPMPNWIYPRGLRLQRLIRHVIFTSGTFPEVHTILNWKSIHRSTFRPESGFRSCPRRDMCRMTGMKRSM